jgi:cell division protein FtsB
MNLDKYLTSLLPSFTKARMIEDLNVRRDELKNNTLPPLKSIQQAFGKRSWENDWVRAFDERFKKAAEIRYQGNFINGVLDTMERVLETCDVIENLINEYFADDVLREAMTVCRVNLLQYLETMSFSIDYTRRLMVATLTLEVATVNKEDPFNGQITQGEMDYLNRRQEAYFQAIRILSDKKEAVQKRFKEMPDMTVNADSVSTATAVVGVTKIDPFGFGLIPVSLNPIYHIRMAIADWQVSKFKAAQEERRILEFKLLQLKLAAEGKKDAKLQQQIEYTQGRLDKLKFKIRDMEEDYGTA